MGKLALFEVNQFTASDLQHFAGMVANVANTQTKGATLSAQVIFTFH